MDSNASYFSSGQVFSPASASYPAQPSSKKFLPKKILLAIFIFIILAAAIFGAIFIFNNTGSRGEKKLFNEYANYLLYGKESTDDIADDYVWGYRYYGRDLDVIFSDEYQTYLNNLKNKYERLANKASKKVAEYDDVFWLFYYTSYYPDITHFDVLAAKESGASDSEITSEIESYYAPFLSSKNAKVKSYGEAKIHGLTNGEEIETFPDYNIEIFQKVWDLKEKFYEK